jgi:hypothetical protein
MHAGNAGRLGWIVMTLLAGCAAAPPAAPAAPPAAMTTEVLAKLATHHAHDLDAFLGKPHEARKAGDGMNYVWLATETVSSYVPNSASATSGFIGKPAPDATDQSTGGNVEHDVTCKLRVTTDATELIRSLDFNGPHKVCDNAARHLADWIRSGG